MGIDYGLFGVEFRLGVVWIGLERLAWDTSGSPRTFGQAEVWRLYSGVIWSLPNISFLRKTFIEV